MNWNGSSSNTYNITSHRRDSNIAPSSRALLTIHRSSLLRYGDRLGYLGYSSYGARDSSSYRDRLGSDAVVGLSQREPSREGRREERDYSSSTRYESAYSRFARERAEDERRYSGYRRTEERRSSNAERDREHVSRRGAVAGMYERDRTGSGYGCGVERQSSSYRSRRDSEQQASGGAHQGERNGSAAAADWSGYRRSSAEGRHAFSPDEY